MKCLNCYSEFHPTLLNPICQHCGYCYYCRDFICFHHDRGISETGTWNSTM